MILSLVSRLCAYSLAPAFICPLSAIIGSMLHFISVSQLHCCLPERHNCTKLSLDLECLLLCSQVLEGSQNLLSHAHLVTTAHQELSTQCSTSVCLAPGVIEQA